MNDISPKPNDVAVERWLADRHRALVTDLSDVLDIEVGLREATIPARHRDLVSDLTDVLDIEAGLSDIIPHTAPPASGSGQEPALAEHQALDDRPPRVLTLMELTDDIGLATAALRLALRAPTLNLVRALDLGTVLVDVGVSVRDLGSALEVDLGGPHLDARDRERARILAHTRALVRVLDIARHLDWSITSAMDLVRGLVFGRRASDRAQTLAHALDRAIYQAWRLARDLISARDFERARDLTQDLIRVLDLEQTQDLALDLALNLARDVTLDLIGDFVDVEVRPEDLAQFAAESAVKETATVVAVRVDSPLPPYRPTSSFLQALLTAVEDFTGADLREVDLTGVSLDGLRWSRTTQWPAEWINQIERDSVYLGGGVYEIRRGTTNAWTRPGRHDRT